MKVISKKNTRILIKGCQYEVYRIWNDGSNSWRDGMLQLRKFGPILSVENFTYINGKKLSRINYSATGAEERYIRLEFKDVKKGDILLCETDGYKTFVKDGMYKVEKTITVKGTRINFVGTMLPIEKKYIKFVGIKRKIIFNGWNFRKLTVDENRKKSLSEILEGEKYKIILSGDDVRNIDLVDDKDDILLKILSKSILDKNRHHLSIVDWACEKIGDKLSIKKEDYEPYMNMTFAEILEKIK